MRVLVIIPAYNESASILSTIESLDRCSEVDYVVINDGSTDDTEKILVGHNIPHIRLIENLGIGGAMQTGYKYAMYHDYDCAIQLDGDGQHDPFYIEALLDECSKGSDMVIGSRFIDNKGFQSTFTRRIGIKLIAGTISLLGCERVTDTTSGFRAVNRKLIELFSQKYPDDYPESETVMMVLRKGFKVKEIPVVMRERTGGKTSITPIKSLYFILKVMIAILFSFNMNKKTENRI